MINPVLFLFVLQNRALSGVVLLLLELQNVIMWVISFKGLCILLENHIFERLLSTNADCFSWDICEQK